MLEYLTEEGTAKSTSEEEVRKRMKEGVKKELEEILELLKPWGVEGF